jgi:hypothetical protein
MAEKMKKHQPLLLVTSVIFLLLTYVPLFMAPSVVEVFVNEDLIFETLTPVYFFITSVLLFVIFFNLRRAEGRSGFSGLKRLAVIGLALLFFVAAGEEISWGQRIFNIETPEAIKQSNVQQELTIHNLDFFQGETATLDFSQLQTLFSLAFAFALPLAGLAGQRIFKFDLDDLLPVMPLNFGWLVVVNYVIQKVIRNIVEVIPQIYLHPTMPFVEGLYEVREHGNAYAMMLSVLFYLIFLLYPRTDK